MGLSLQRRAVTAGVLCVLSVLAVCVVVLSINNEAGESALAERGVNVRDALGHVSYAHGVFSAESEDRDASEFFPKEYKHGASTGVDDVIASVEADLAGVAHSKKLSPAERINTGEHIQRGAVQMAHADDHPNPFLSARHELGMIATKHPSVKRVRRKVRKVQVRKAELPSAIKWKVLQHKLHKELRQKSMALIPGSHENAKKRAAKKAESAFLNKKVHRRDESHKKNPLNPFKKVHKKPAHHPTKKLVKKAIKRMTHKLKAVTHIRSAIHTQKLHKLVKRAERGMEHRLKVAKRKNKKISAQEKSVKAHRMNDVTKARVRGDAALSKAQRSITKKENRAEDKYFERKLHSQFNKIVRASFARKDLPSKKAISAPAGPSNTAGPFKKAAQRRVAKKTKHLRSKVLRLSAKLAKLRQESTLRKAKLRLKASKMRAQQRLSRLKDARDDELEIARFSQPVRKKLRSLHKALLRSKTKAFQRKKLAQLKREEKRAFAKVLQNQQSVSRMTAKLAAAKAHLVKLSKHKVARRKKQPSVMMAVSLKNIEGHRVSREEEIGGLEDEVLNMEKQMRLQTLTILKQQRLLAAKAQGAGKNYAN